jgi:hypothetical protein
MANDHNEPSQPWLHDLNEGNAFFNQPRAKVVKK